MDKKTLSAKTKFWYGFGDFGFTLMSNVETLYWNAFLTNLAGFTVAMTGVITSVASTIDACLGSMVVSLMHGSQVSMVVIEHGLSRLHGSFHLSMHSSS